MRGGKIDDGFSMHEHEGRRRYEYTLVVILLHAEQGGTEILRSAHDDRMNLYAEILGRGGNPLILAIRSRRARALRSIRDVSLETPEAFGRKIIVQDLRPGDVPPGPSQAGHESRRDK